jgi:alpha-galactosidase
MARHLARAAFALSLGILLAGFASVSPAQGRQASLALVALAATANATLAPTPVPYMGWNTYYQVGSETPGSNNITEATIKSVAQSLVSTGLAKAGYTIVWLDFGWASGARDGNGSLIVDTTQWPGGLSALTSYLHGLGLQAGIYTDAGTSGCSGQGVGSYGHYQQDADQFAAWGFDAVKVDFCGAGQQWLDVPPNDPRTLYAQFSNAVANAGRPMILNVDNFWTRGRPMDRFRRSRTLHGTATRGHRRTHRAGGPIPTSASRESPTARAVSSSSTS